ncbi:FR47-like protein [Seminavis robusta]|uniref:FR47-like protein n=1 Tax=Seminavis robusta TaxID=568900 RepID=A0A9N8D8H5_9STRA|nr:FR47-like protein [Seminavis robusta]|eukprot:Sro30_g019960.1 FR47-like protein (238) ;mRNA; r:167057-168101
MSTSSCRKRFLLFLLALLSCQNEALISRSSEPRTHTRNNKPLLGTKAGTAEFQVDTDIKIKIRDCKYGELHPVSHLVLDAFYADKPNDIFMHMYRLAELNRLQQNFPYADQMMKHRMLVAMASDNNNNDDIVGFVDVDARTAPPNKEYKHNPRPMLSDLMVNPRMRRKGIAKQLVQRCEEICRQDFQETELYIRVLKDNEAAIAMYDSLGYSIYDNPGDPPEVRLLLKQFEPIETVL